MAAERKAQRRREERCRQPWRRVTPWDEDQLQPVAGEAQRVEWKGPTRCAGARPAFSANRASPLKVVAAASVAEETLLAQPGGVSVEEVQAQMSEPGRVPCAQLLARNVHISDAAYPPQL